MSLNIKNDEAERLAREIASATGETLTGAITIALRERLARVQGLRERQVSEREERIRQIGEDAARRWAEPLRHTDHGDLLYDERGLPA